MVDLTKRFPKIQRTPPPKKKTGKNSPLFLPTSAGIEHIRIGRNEDSTSKEQQYLLDDSIL